MLILQDFKQNITEIQNHSQGSEGTVQYAQVMPKKNQSAC